MILVFGSLNMDLIMEVSSLPKPGETVLCPGYTLKPGGKGANQAVAAARAGAHVAMYGHVGADDFGATLVAALGADGIDTRGIARGRMPTGCAAICVDRAAENAITVASGANREAAATQIPLSALGPDATVLLQMEIPHDENWRLIARAREAGARTILNLAPAAPVPRTALEALDILIVNEHEAAAVAHDLGLAADAHAPEALARRLAEAVGVTCIMTLGARGALAASRSDVWQVDALRIDPVDTTGAGDAFVGILAAALDAGSSLPDALRRAAVGSAIACLAVGAQESLPTAADIDARLHELDMPRRLV